MMQRAEGLRPVAGGIHRPEQVAQVVEQVGDVPDGVHPFLELPQRLQQVAAGVLAFEFLDDPDQGAHDPQQRRHPKQMDLAEVSGHRTFDRPRRRRIQHLGEQPLQLSAALLRPGIHPVRGGDFLRPGRSREGPSSGRR